MSVDVEERLRRAATVLDRHVAEPAGGPLYIAPTAARRRPVVLGLAAALIVGLGLSSILVLGRDDGVITHDAPASQPSGATLDSWSTLPPPPITARFQHLAVSTGTGLFVWGGYDGDSNRGDGAYLDATTATWRELPDAPLAGDRGDAIGVWTGTEVVVLNGSDGAKAAAFDLDSFTWRELPNPPLANAANAMNHAVVVGGTVVVVGVADEGEGGATNQVARLDLATSEWTTGALPPVPYESFFDAVAAGDEVIVVGRYGSGGSSCGQAAVLSYDPITDRWRELPVGPAAELISPVVAWSGTELFVGGGNVCYGETHAGTVGYLLEPSSGQWRPAAPAPIGVPSNSRYEEVWTGQSVAVVGDNDTPILYNPATDTWHVGPAGPLGIEQRGETPWAWVDGELVVFGGGIVTDERDGATGCCIPVEWAVAYTPPPGF